MKFNTEDENVFFRFMESRVSYDEYSSHIIIRCHRYRIKRKTPKGTWIVAYNAKGERFILDKAVRKWAHPNKEDALNSFKARKEKQAIILKGQTRQNKITLELINKYSAENIEGKKLPEINDNLLRFSV